MEGLVSVRLVVSCGMVRARVEEEEKKRERKRESERDRYLRGRRLCMMERMIWGRMSVVMV